MDGKEELKRQKRLDRVFEYSTYITCITVIVALPFLGLTEKNSIIVCLISLPACIHAFVNYRLIPHLNEEYVSWHYRSKHFLFIVLDFSFVTMNMFFSGGIHSPYFFIFFLPLIVGSIILPQIYLVIQVIIIYLCYLLVRFYTFGFWPLFDQNLFFSFASVALVAFLVTRTAGEERRAREKAQLLASQVREANVKLQELDKMKDEFLEIASHELRTPMAAIKGFISLVLSGGGGKLEPQAKEYLKQAYQGNERLIRLISDLLSISRIESGRAEYMAMDFDPQEIVEDAIGELKSEAHRKRLFLRQKRLPFKVYVKGDAEKLKEVIFNLLSNGIKFTDHGGVEAKYEVPYSHLIVRVTDTGEGIDEKGQELIFKKFQQIGPLLRRHPGGTGLGLYIARRYLEAMGGKIWLDKSEVGKGSTFAFQLPCHHLEDLSKLYEPGKIDEKAKRFFLAKEKSN